MNFWEDFFSTDKIIYPIMISVFFGILFKVATLTLNKELDDLYLYITMFIGFLIGAYFKAIKLEEEYEEQKKLIKKSKK